MQRLDRIVALKVPHLLDWDEVRRSLFLREARAAATLEHPHIVRVHGIDQDGDKLAIISQFIEGQTLTIFRNNPKGVLEKKQTVSLVRPDEGGPNEVDYVTDGTRPKTLKSWVERDGDTVKLTFKALPDDVAVGVRLRRLLKIAGRQLHLKCVRVEGPATDGQLSVSDNSELPETSERRVQ